MALPDIKRSVNQSDQENINYVGRSIRARRDYYHINVTLQIDPRTNFTDEGLVNFASSLYEGLKSAKRELENVSKVKSHGRRRSTREIGDIQTQRAAQINQINHTLEVIRGDQPGAIRLVTTKNSETGKFEITSYDVVDNLL